MNVAIVSDIHANIYALESVFTDIEKNKCRKVLILGDLVGYYYWPKKVISKIRNDPRCIVIKGNHEELLERSLVDPEFEKKCHVKYGSGLRYCQKQLSGSDINWLKALPTSIQLEIDGVNIGMYHGSEKSTNEYVYPDTRDARLSEIITKQDFMFFGHTHYPMIIKRENFTIANPGSVGQPRDVGSLASYLILNTKNRELTNRRVPFDIKPLQVASRSNDPHYLYLHEILLRKQTI